MSAMLTLLVSSYRFLVGNIKADLRLDAFSFRSTQTKHLKCRLTPSPQVMLAASFVVLQLEKELGIIYVQQESAYIRAVSCSVRRAIR